jgi:hypothetical protein
MTLKRQGFLKQTANRARKWMAPLLVAGIMTLGLGKANAMQKFPLERTTLRSSGLAVACLTNKKCTYKVKSGDVLLETKISNSLASSITTLKVTKIDRWGVEFEYRGELISVVTTAKFRFNYKGTQRPKDWPATRFIKVKRTRNPNIAEVTFPHNFSWTLFYGRKTKPIQPKKPLKLLPFKPAKLKSIQKVIKPFQPMTRQDNSTFKQILQKLPNTSSK